MKGHVDEIRRAALELPPEERERLGLELLDSVELPPEEQAAFDRAWAEEIERRLEAFESGRSKSEPWESVRARLLRSIE